MISYPLNSNSNPNNLVDLKSNATCTCYICSICIVCIAFAPIVGVSLSLTLSTALLNTQQK